MPAVKMPSVSLGAVFAGAFCVSIVPLFFVERYGEQHWGFDNIGTWYTVYCAVISALIFAGVAVVVAGLVRVVRKLIAERRA